VPIPSPLTTSGIDKVEAIPSAMAVPENSGQR
jgi:hypothetical protein